MSDLADIIAGQKDPVQTYLQTYYGAQKIGQDAVDRKEKLAQQKLYMTLAGLRDIRAEEAATARDKKELFQEQSKVEDKEAAKLKDAWTGLPDVLAGMKNPDDPEEAKTLVSSYLQTKGIDPAKFPTPNDLLTAIGRSARAKNPGLRDQDPRLKEVPVGDKIGVVNERDPFNPDGSPKIIPGLGGDRYRDRAPQVPHFSTQQGIGEDGKPAWFKVNNLTGDIEQIKAKGGGAPAPKGSTARPAFTPTQKLAYVNTTLARMWDKDQKSYLVDGNPVSETLAKKVAMQAAERDIEAFSEAPAGNTPPSQEKPGTSGMTATNKKTGQKIISYDGGKTWQPVQ